MCFLVLLLGPALLFAGIGLLVTTDKTNHRADKMDSVKRAVATWKGDGPMSAEGFKAQRFTAVVKTMDTKMAACTAIQEQTVPMQVDEAPTDSWVDERRKFCCGAYPQVRFTAQVKAVPEGCGYDVAFRDGDGNTVGGFEQPNTFDSNGDGPVPLDFHQGKEECGTSLESCEAEDGRDCAANCKGWGGAWTCNPSPANDSLLVSCEARASFNDMCVKVSRTGKEPFQVDSTFGTGCHAVPPYFLRGYGVPRVDPPNAAFQVANLSTVSPAFVTSGTLTVTLRSAGDPWLTYMRETEGTGDFGPSGKKEYYQATGILVAGILLTILWLLCVYSCARHCCCPPAKRPAGSPGRVYDMYAWAGLVKGNSAASPDGTPFVGGAGNGSSGEVPGFSQPVYGAPTAYPVSVSAGYTGGPHGYPKP